MRRTIELAVFGVVAVVLAWQSALPAGHGGGKQGAGSVIHLPSTIKWQEGPPSLPKGAQVALLEGDLSKPGPFVLRVKLPDGYKVPPHFHPKTERVTVLSGTFYIGMGDRFDEKAGKAMPAGSYGAWAAGMKHFAWVKGETVIQVHGDGPWAITYLNPADDPRNAKK
jgi:hypothetical protein